MTNEEKVKKRIKDWERACKKEKKKEKMRIQNAFMKLEEKLPMNTKLIKKEDLIGIRIFWNIKM